MKKLLLLLILCTSCEKHHTECSLPDDTNYRSMYEEAQALDLRDGEEFHLNIGGDKNISLSTVFYYNPVVVLPDADVCKNVELHVRTTAGCATRHSGNMPLKADMFYDRNGTAIATILQFEFGANKPAYCTTVIKSKRIWGQWRWVITCTNAEYKY